MKFRLLFTIFVVLLGGALTYGEALPENFSSFYSKLFRGTVDQGQQEEIKVEEDQTQSGKNAGSKNLVHEELTSLPRAPETKPIEPKQEVSAPPGLKVSPPQAGGSEPANTPPPVGGLTQAGIILQTNFQRQESGLGFLGENGILNSTATAKANDMCEKQYFAHISQAGIGAGGLADSFGYDYISVGENLALGPFASDVAVVEAWMGSPGHRANILNSKFTEIGVGAVGCVFEGRSTWLAVQHFGKPASDCPKVDVSLGKTIEEEKATLAEMKGRLLVMRAGIEASNPETDPDYNNKVGSYNSLVQEYNSLIGETKTLINQYNSQITAFNACASS